MNELTRKIMANISFKHYGPEGPGGRGSPADAVSDHPGNASSDRQRAFDEAVGLAVQKIRAALPGPGAGSVGGPLIGAHNPGAHNPGAHTPADHAPAHQTGGCEQFNSSPARGGQSLSGPAGAFPRASSGAGNVPARTPVPPGPPAGSAPVPGAITIAQLAGGKLAGLKR
ncbi:MAG: hypothetical protein LBO05_05010 [Deltaproteobacteria bacterium]|jgi:hypothetical protein|nr:hypothetical protein [Deltaproteobacteria bacterium]